MKDIKTKEVTTKPKTKNPASRIPKELMRTAILESKEKSQAIANARDNDMGEQSPSEYASGKVASAEEWAARKTGRTVTRAGKTAAQTSYEKIKQRVAGKKEAEKEARRLLEKMGLGDKADVYPCQLSGGQQQRVAIARALALKPSILFFDEPTSALDPELTGEILKVIRELAEEKMTMVIVTHEMSFARDVADRVIFMDGGYIIEQGDPKEVIEHPKEERTRQFLARFMQG